MKPVYRAKLFIGLLTVASLIGCKNQGTFQPQYFLLNVDDLVLSNSPSIQEGGSSVVKTFIGKEWTQSILIANTSPTATYTIKLTEVVGTYSGKKVEMTCSGSESAVTELTLAPNQTFRIGCTGMLPFPAQQGLSTSDAGILVVSIPYISSQNIGSADLRFPIDKRFAQSEVSSSEKSDWISANVRAGRVEEPRAWKNTETRHTGGLYHQCGLNIETRLADSSGRRFLFMTLSNPSARAVYLKLNRLKTTPRFIETTQPELVEPGEIAFVQVELADAISFASVNRIKASLPVGVEKEQVDCTIEMEFEKKDAEPDSEVVEIRSPPGTGTSKYWAYDASLGASFLKAGSISDLGRRSYSIGLHASYYLAPPHGIFLGMVYESFGGNTPGFEGGYFALGYSHRRQLGERFSLTLNGAPAIYDFAYRSLANPSGEDLPRFALIQEVGLDYVIMKGPSNFFSLSAWVYNAWVPAAKFGTIDLSGDSMGGLLGVKLGL